MTDKTILSKLDSDFEFCEMFIEHALTLGYLGEGSTQGMANDALTKVKSSRELIKKVNKLFEEPKKDNESKKKGHAPYEQHSADDCDDPACSHY